MVVVVRNVHLLILKVSAFSCQGDTYQELLNFLQILVFIVKLRLHIRSIKSHLTWWRYLCPTTPPLPEREPEVVPDPAIPEEAEADELFSPPPPLKILVVITAEV